MKIVKLYFKQIDGTYYEVDVTHLVSAGSIVKTQTLCNNSYKSTVDDCSFSLQYKRDKTLAQLFLNQHQIKCTITETDGTPFFKGVILDGISQTLDVGAEEISLTVVDNSYNLDNECSEFAIENAIISKPTDTDASIIHQLLILAGYELTEIEIDTLIATTLRVVANEKGEKTWRQIIDDLLFEYGYVLVFNNGGKATIKPWITCDIANALILNSSNVMASGLTRQKKEREYSGVKVVWSDLKDTADFGNTGKESLYIGSLSFGVDSTGKEKGTDIIPGGYWPTNYLSAADTIYQTYNFEPLNYSDQSSDKSLFYIKKANKNLSLLYSYDHELSIRDSEGIYPNGAIELFEPVEFFQKKAKIVLKNNTQEMTTLFRVDVNAHAVFRYNRNESLSFYVDELTGNKLFPTENKNYEYTSKYIYNRSTAENLANLIRREKQYGSYQFSFSSNEKLNVGDVVELIQDDFSSFIIIEEAVLTDEIPGVTYSAKSISSIQIESTQTITTTGNQTISQQMQNLESEIENLNIVTPQELFGNDAFALTPTTKPILTAIPNFHANVLRVVGLVGGKKLSSIIDLAAYEIQCSLNNSKWFELTDFLDSEPIEFTYTSTNTPMYVHWYKFNGNEDEPTAFEVFYRVRIRSGKGVVSLWSDPISSISLTIENGDIAANSITANKIQAASITSEKLTTDILQTLFFQTQNIVIGSSKNYLNENIKIGDNRIRIDDDELIFEQCVNVEGDPIWGNNENIKIGGSVFDIFISMIKSSGIYNCDPKDVVNYTGYEFKKKTHQLFTFDQKWESEFNPEIQISDDIKKFLEFDSDIKKFGSHSIKVKNMMIPLALLRSPEKAYRIGKSFSSGVWLKLGMDESISFFATANNEVIQNYFKIDLGKDRLRIEVCKKKILTYDQPLPNLNLNQHYGNWFLFYVGFNHYENKVLVGINDQFSYFEIDDEDWGEGDESYLAFFFSGRTDIHFDNWFYSEQIFNNADFFIHHYQKNKPFEVLNRSQSGDIMFVTKNETGTIYNLGNVEVDQNLQLNEGKIKCKNGINLSGNDKSLKISKGEKEVEIILADSGNTDFFTNGKIYFFNKGIIAHGNLHGHYLGVHDIGCYNVSGRNFNGWNWTGSRVNVRETPSGQPGAGVSFGSAKGYGSYSLDPRIYTGWHRRLLSLHTASDWN